MRVEVPQENITVKDDALHINENIKFKGKPGFFIGKK